MSKFLSGRLRRLLVGITGYTENNTVVQTTGKVGIGTTDAQQHSLFVVGSTNITGDTIVGGGLTAVGIGSFQSNVYIDNQLYVGGVNITGGASVGADLNARNLNLTGIATVAGLTDLNGDLNVAGVSTFQNNVHLLDDDKLLLGGSAGTHDGLEIYHDSNNSYITDSGSGNLLIGSDNDLWITNAAGTENKARFTTNGSVKLYYDNSKKFETIGAGVTVTGTTFSNQLNVSGLSTFQSNVHLLDSVELRLGTGNDLKIYHNSNNSFVSNVGTGDLNLSGDDVIIASSAFENKAKFLTDGAVELYYDNSKKFETTGIGVSVLSGAGLTATIAGPANLIIDPGTVGDDTGLVRIKGDLYVDGTEFIVNSSTIDLADLKVGIATTVTTNLLLDGGGIAIGDPSIEKTLLWNNSNSRMEFNADLYAPNFTTGNINLTNLYVSGLSTFAGITTVTGPTLFTKQLNVSGIATFQSHAKFGDGDRAIFGQGSDMEIYHSGSQNRIDTQNAPLRIDNSSTGIILWDDANTNNMARFNTGGSVDLYHNGTKRLETTGIGVSIYDDLNVGTGVTVYGNVGIVSAYQFWGDGANLTNTGASLSAASGTERLVLTNLTTGTMVSAATSSGLTFNANTNVLATPNLQAVGISTNGSNFGASGYVPVANGSGGWDWLNLQGASAVNTILNGFTVSEEGATVGTAGSITQLDFRGVNILASADVQPNGIATITMSETPTFQALNLTGITTLGGPVTAGSSEGVNGQYLRHVGTGVTWANFPTLRTTQTTSASDNQTTFNFTYNVNFLDVFVNGVKLTSSEYTATNGSQVILDSPAFAGDIVEFHSYNTASTYGGGGGGSYGNSDVDNHLNTSTASTGEVLSWNGSDYDWVAQSGGSGSIVGIATTGTSFFNVIDTPIPEHRIPVIGAGGTISHLPGFTYQSGVLYVQEGTGTISAGGEVSSSSLSVSGNSLLTGDVNVSTGELTVGTAFTVGQSGVVTATSFEGSGSSLTGLTGASAATYGNGTAVPQITVDANGRITGITNVSISGGGGGGGTSMFIRDNGSLVGAAGTIDFGTGLSVTPVSAGIVTVGINTANINANTLNVSGISTFASGLKVPGGTGVSNRIELGNGQEFTLQYNTATTKGIISAAANPIDIQATTIKLLPNVGENGVIVNQNGSVELYYDNAKKIETTNTGVTVTGTVAATAFSGDGSALTGISSTTAEWTLGANGSSDYTFTGPGVADGAQDPTIYLVRGQTYKFKNRTGSHPFRIQYEFQNTGGTAYTDGIVISDGSSASSGAGNNADLYWEVRNDAPDLLHYQCTSHTNMSGRIVILGDVVTNGSWTAAANTLVNIDTISGITNNDVKTAEYTLHIEHSTGIQAQKVLVMQNGTAYSQEYAIMHTTANPLVSIGASIHSGNLHLNATPETGVTGITTYRFTRQTIR